ncbi:MAG: hypothetical protein M0P58_03825 [Bacteroidales bacterium]|jgi:hypothetical protein|nr:hypothetical protein [Bacteroidales bacterium]
MKNKCLLIGLFLFFFNFSFSQGVAVSDQSNATVSTGAVLDVSSSSALSSAKGFLPPRIVSEKYAVSSKSDGLMYYFSSDKSYGYWTSGGWYSFAVSGPYQGADVNESDPVSQSVMFTPLGGMALKMINKTGAITVKGQIVSPSPTTENGFILASASSVNPVGVVFEAGIEDGSACWIVVSGVAEVLLADTQPAAMGYEVQISSTSGRAETKISDLTSTAIEIGHCIQSVSGGADQKVKVILHFN